MKIRQVKYIFPALAALAVLGGCGQSETASAPSQAAEVTLASGLTVKEQVEARQAQFKKMGKAFKTVSDQLKSSDPDIAAIQAAAATLPAETADMADWFPAGTGPESGVKTEALAAIWETPADFSEKVIAFKDAATTFNSVAQSGDIGAISVAFKETGGTCKSCHDTYRADD